VKRYALLVLLLLGSGCARDPGPARTVFGFYTAYASIGFRGLPGPAHTAQLAPFLSQRLLAQIDSAREVQDAFSFRFPEEKPPFVEGDLFSSNFEGFSGFAVDSVTTLPEDRFQVRVNFWYVDPVDPKTIIRWYDRVEVLRLERRYVIDDVEFLAPWPFAQKGRLSEILRQDDTKSAGT